MYHPTVKELVEEALISQIAIRIGQEKAGNIKVTHPEHFEALLKEFGGWFDAVIDEDYALRRCHFVFAEKYPKEVLINYLEQQLPK